MALTIPGMSQKQPETECSDLGVSRLSTLTFIVPTEKKPVRHSNKVWIQSLTFHWLQCSALFRVWRQWVALHKRHSWIKNQNLRKITPSLYPFRAQILFIVPFSNIWKEPPKCVTHDVKSVRKLDSKGMHTLHKLDTQKSSAHEWKRPRYPRFYLQVHKLYLSINDDQLSMV